MVINHLLIGMILQARAATSWKVEQAEVIQGVAIPTVLFFILRRLNKKSGTPSTQVNLPPLPLTYK